MDFIQQLTDWTGQLSGILWGNPVTLLVLLGTGGMGEFIKVAAMLQSRGKKVATHSWGAGGSFMQNIHAGFGFNCTGKTICGLGNTGFAGTLEAHKCDPSPRGVA